MTNKPNTGKKLDSDKKDQLRNFVDSIPAINKVTDYNVEVLNNWDIDKIPKFFDYKE